MNPQKFRNFALATDGSELSRIALKTLLNEFITPADIVTVISITDKTKQYLHEEFKPANIQKIFRNDLITHVFLAAFFGTFQNHHEGKVFSKY